MVPEAFLADEIDRCIFCPAQALAYLTGKLCIAALRDRARRGARRRFRPPRVPSAVVDHGSPPMPVLEQAVTAWITPG